MKMIAEVDSVTKEISPFLDRYSELNMLQARAFLNSQGARLQQVFSQRFDMAQVADLHGGLTIEKIYVSLATAKKKVFFVGRELRDKRVNDVLFDVATLVVDLEARGYIADARHFEAEYFKHNSATLNFELYRFYVVYAVFSRVSMMLAGSDERDDQLIAKLLSVSCRYVLGLRSSFLIALGGETISFFCLSLVKWLNFSHRGEGGVRRGFWVVMAEKFFQNLLSLFLKQTQLLMTNCFPVALAWRFRYVEELLAARSIAEKQNAVFLFVRSDSKQFSATSVFDTYNSLGINYCTMSQEMPLPEFSLDVLQTLRTITMREQRCV